MSDDILAQAFEQLLKLHCTPAAVRAIESGGAFRQLWHEIIESGFADALVSEECGGAGLSVREIFPLLKLCGGYALPLPLAYTMLARALLTEEIDSFPDATITIARASTVSATTIACKRVDWGLVAEWVLVECEDRCFLLPTAAAHVTPCGVKGSLLADLFWSEIPRDVQVIAHRDLRQSGSILLAAQMSGAMLRLLDTTLQYANDRSQFGKPIGKFQAIQQQLSVMAQQVYGAHVAAEVGCRCTLHPSAMQAALSKSRCSEAVVLVTAIAHSVHGAIGMTEEYDLQLLTRRLNEWRLSNGSEDYWHKRIGQAVIASGDMSLDFARNITPALTGHRKLHER